MIKNEAKPMEEKVEYVRSAIEHRATWFYLLLEEMKKRGIDREELGRAAVYNCGCFHGDQKKAACADCGDLREFSKVFADDTYHNVFQMEILEETEDKFSVDFHYCPLVAAWIKAGAKEEDMPLLCDIAMEGDRGVVSRFDGYTFKLDGTIAEGEPVCRIRIEKK